MFLGVQSQTKSYNSHAALQRHSHSSSDLGQDMSVNRFLPSITVWLVVQTSFSVMTTLYHHQCLFIKQAPNPTSAKIALATILSTATMSKLPSKAFSNPQLQDDLGKVTTASAVVQIYTQMVLKQADIKLDALPDLPKHQQLARKNAKSWNKTILPGMAKTTADIIDYANMFQSFYEVLVKFAKDISKPDSKKKLVEGLKQLHDQVQVKSDATQTVIRQLTDFHAALTVDNQNFQGDYNVALVKIVGQDGEIKALSDRLDAVHAAMHKDIGLMAGGAVAIVGGIVLMVVGIALEIPTAGVSTALVGGGFFLLAGGALIETLGASDYTAQIKTQRTVTEELETDKKGMTSLKNVKGILDNFLKSIGDAITAAEVLVAAWNALGADVAIVIEAIDRVNPSITSDYIVAQLDTANKDWQVALKKAEQLQPNSQVDLKFSDNLEKTYDEAKPKG